MSSKNYEPATYDTLLEQASPFPFDGKVDFVTDRNSARYQIVYESNVIQDSGISRWSTN